jgi:hypothetical protein
MLVVLEALRVARSRDVLSILLRIVNLIVGSDPSVLEKIAVRVNLCDPTEDLR